MKYLAIANQKDGLWTAVFYEKTTNNTNLFNLIETATQNLAEITIENYATIVDGKISGDNIYDIEPVLRRIGFRKCDICGCWVTPQDIRNGLSTYSGGQRKCALCLAKDREKTLDLDGYHDTEDDVRVINAPGENFTLSNVLGVGIEFEYWHGTTHDCEIKCTDIFYEMAKPNSLNRIFRCEQDGTVSGEIITNVFTKKSLYDFDWNIITDVMKLNKNVDGNGHAGMHVHLSKLWLGTTPKEQCLNFLKLQYFMKCYEDDFLRLSRRKRDQMYYCQFFSYGEIERMKQNILNLGNAWDYMPCHHGGGNGCALNAPENTIEFRIGLNTNDPERIKHYLRFILGITENIKNVPFEKCYCIRKVTRLVPDETMLYWRKQGCFLHTNALDTRGVTIM